MPEFLPDPEMEQLVHELNRLAENRALQGAQEEEGSLAILDAPALQNVVTGEQLAELLQEMVERGASDLLLIPGSAPVIRTAGRLHRLQGGPIESESVRGMFASHLGPRSRRSLAEKGAADFSLTFPSLEAGRGDVRLRVNLHRQRGRLAAAVRALPPSVLVESFPGVDGTPHVLAVGPLAQLEALDRQMQALKARRMTLPDWLPAERDAARTVTSMASMLAHEIKNPLSGIRGAAQLLETRSGESVIFTHDKIREVRYHELNPIRRRRLHTRVAEGLEAAEIPEPLEDEALLIPGEGRRRIRHREHQRPRPDRRRRRLGQ